MPQMRVIICALFAVLLSRPAAAAPSGPCSPAIAAAETQARIAPGLLHAIGLVESGRLDPRTRQRAPWPWTVTADGAGTFFAGKADAIRAVEALRHRGIASIDVGCMQINLLHHPAAFSDLSTAFDPVANARYAAHFLVSLHTRLGTWPGAAAAYHSLTPELGRSYGRLVATVWSGAPVPTAVVDGGLEVVRFPGGGQLRLMRDSTSSGRIAGFLTGP